MAMFENLEWVLTAEDKASATFDKVAKAQQDVQKSSDSMTKSVNGAGSSWTDIAKGVFAGGVALGAAKQAFDLLKNTVMEGIAEVEEYETVQAQLAAAITSTGGAANLTMDELNAMADEYANMAQGGSEAINALQSQLLTFTGITKENFGAVTQAALDMTTRLNNGVLPTAEQLKGQAIQLGKALNSPKDGLTALTRVGVVFTDEQKKTIETLQDAGDTMGAQRVILEELAKEYGGSAAAATKTFQGRMVALTNSIGDAKKIIGQALLPTLSLMIGDVADATGKIKVNDETMLLWQKRIFVTVESIKTIIKIMGGFAGVIIAVANVFVKAEQVILAFVTDVGKGLFNLGDSAKRVFEALKQAVTGDFSGAVDTLSSLVKDRLSTTIDYAGQYMNALDGIGSSISAGIQNAGDAITSMAEKTAAFDQVAKDMNATAGAATGLGNAMGGAGESAGEAADKAQDALAQLQEDYNGAQEKIGDALLSLEDDHAKSVAAIKEKLVSLQDSLKDTMDTYQKTMADLNKTEAEGVVQQEQKIADLQKQLLEAQESVANAKEGTTPDTSRVDELTKQLAQEQKAYDDYIANRTGLEAELIEARRRASETEFQRFIEDTNAKRTEEQAAYDAKIALIQGEVAEQEAALVEEQTIYEAKKAMYATVQAAFQEFHDKYLTNLDEMRSYTSDAVGVMTAELKRISDLFSQIQSLKASAGLAGVSLGTPGEGIGGSTTNDNSSVTQQVTNNITVQVQGDQAAAAATVAEIKRQLTLAGLGSQ